MPERFRGIHHMPLFSFPIRSVTRAFTSLRISSTLLNRFNYSFWLSKNCHQYPLVRQYFSTFIRSGILGPPSLNCAGVSVRKEQHTCLSYTLDLFSFKVYKSPVRLVYNMSNSEQDLGSSVLATEKQPSVPSNLEADSIPSGDDHETQKVISKETASGEVCLSVEARDNISTEVKNEGDVNNELKDSEGKPECKVSSDNFESETDKADEVPKKSKNQLKREKKKALWNQQKEEWKEKKRQKKLEKEKQEMEELKDVEFNPSFRREKRKAEEEALDNTDIKKAKLETKALKAKRPGFSEERYNETSYYIENGLRKVYPYYFTFTTFTKGRWVGEKILDVFAKEFRAHPAEEYERCIKSGTLTVNYEKVDTDYRLKHNDLLANIVHRHETPVLARNIAILHLDEDLVVLDKPCSLPVHPCGRYRHNTVVFILAKEYNLKNLRTIHRLDRLTSGLLLFGRTPKKAREMEQQIRTRQVTKEYVCRVEGEFPREHVECNEPIEVVSYKIGVCKVSPTGKDCRTEFQRLSYNGKTSVVLCRPHTGRMHQIRVHLQYLGYPIVNDPLYNHTVFGPNKAKGGIIGKTDEQLIQDLIKIHNAENWLGMDGDAEYSMFKGRDKADTEEEGGSQRNTPSPKEKSPPANNSPRVTSPPALIAPTGYQSPKAIGPSVVEIQSSMVGTEAAPPKTLNGCNSGLAGGEAGVVVSSGTQTSEGTKEYGYQACLMTIDEHCYECKVRYRDPKPRDLVMYLHALKYAGPGWQFETKLPDWAHEEWGNPEEEQ